MMLELERDVVFRMYDFHDLTKEQLRERTMEKVRYEVRIDALLQVKRRSSSMFVD
jgi:hypothetical protein